MFNIWDLISQCAAVYTIQPYAGQRLRRNGVEVVLAEEPMVRMIGHIFHQAKSLHYGLSQFSDDDLVLKTRTDKVWLNFDIGYTRDRLENAPAPGPISPFKQRIIIQTSLVFQPFFFNDALFAGRAADLHKLATFDLWY